MNYLEPMGQWPKDDHLMQSDVNHYVIRHYEKMTHEFLAYANAMRYPGRCWRTYAAILMLSRGRARFRVSRKEICRLAGSQDKRTTQRAITILERDGWIIRHANRSDDPRRNFYNDYTITDFLRPGANVPPNIKTV